MDEISWYIGIRIARDGAGAVHWFIESSDGLSHGHLVDEGRPASLMGAVLACRREAFAEMQRLVAGEQIEFVFPDAPPHVGP